MALFATSHTTAESAAWSIERLSAEELTTEVAFHEGQLTAERYFGETPADVALRQAHAEWWLERIAEAAA